MPEMSVRSVFYAMQRAFQISRYNKALINPGRLDKNLSAQAARELVPTGLHLTADQILSMDDAVFDRSRAEGLVVSGYSDVFLREGRTKEEDALQSYIRGTVNNSGKPTFPLLVLAETLPHPTAFTSHRPWGNGPFEPRNGVFGLEPTPEGLLTLIQYKPVYEGPISFEPSGWEAEQTFDI